MMHKNIKAIMWDSLQSKSDKVGLFVRTMQGNITIVINFMTVKYFSLSTFAIVLNMAPFCTLVLAALFLKETMTIMNIVSLIIAFIGVALVIKGGMD